MNTTPAAKADYCFVTSNSPAGVAQIEPLISAEALRTVLVSDEPSAPLEYLARLTRLIRQSRFVVAINLLPTLDPAVAFQIGLAAALGKPIMVVVAPETTLPHGVDDLLLVRTRKLGGEDVSFAFRQFVDRYGTAGKPKKSTPRRPSTRPIGPLSVQLRSELKDLPVAGPHRAEGIERLIARAIEASGASVTYGSMGQDAGWDLGVWSDDLESFGANPLAITIKSRLNASDARAFWLASAATLRLGLVLYEQASEQAVTELQRRYPLLAFRLDDFLEQLATRSFAEVVRAKRNAVLHGR
jgi:hypothetical protein